MYLAGGRVPEYQSAIKRTKHKKELAKLALRIYIYDLQRYVACYAGLLGRVEAVVFSGGVGEHRQEIRQAVMEGVHFINKPRVLIVPANEELLIAEKIRKFM